MKHPTFLILVHWRRRTNLKTGEERYSVSGRSRYDWDPNLAELRGRNPCSG
jgi:hypothetical protein